VPSQQIASRFIASRFMDALDTPPLARMRAFERRALTPGEIALARGIFADSIPYARVGVLQIPPLNFHAMVPLGTTILFSRWRAPHDFAPAPLLEQGWLIHELAHVWQAQGGRVLAAAKLVAMGPAAYRPPKGAPFAAMNIEAQAEVARLLFLARCGGQCTPFERAELEALWPVKA
jgi:hypothetical protein